MSGADKGTRLGLRLFGKVTPEVAMEAAGHLKGLANALTTEVVSDPAGIHWELTTLVWECDGCGRTRPRHFRRWRNDGTYDWCPACQRKGVCIPMASRRLTGSA